MSDNSEYFVRLGDPMTDAVPEISLWKEWSITSRYPDGSVASFSLSNSTALVYTLDYSTFENDTARKWSACGQKSGGWVLY